MKRIFPPLFGAFVMPALVETLFQWLSHAQSSHRMAELDQLVFVGVLLAGAACLMCLPGNWFDLLEDRIAAVVGYLIVYVPVLWIFRRVLNLVFAGID